MSLICLVADYQPAQVGNIFSKSELAVYMYTPCNGKVVVLLYQRLAFRFELFLVCRRPPEFKVALAVKLGALVVKAVRYLVPDNRADTAVVKSIVGRKVKERGLEYRRREDYLIHRGVEVGIYCLRIHKPLVAVDRLARELAHFALAF